MLRMPASHPAVEPLRFPGLRGQRVAITATPLTNLVGVAAPGTVVDRPLIRAVRQEFASLGLPFGWLVGPYSPDGLGELLETEGMALMAQFSGMHSNDPTPIDVPAGVEVREVGPDDQPLFREVLREAFGLPMDVARFMCEALYFNQAERPCRNYLAWLDGVHAPVGAASSVYEAEAPVVHLAGAAVLEEHRRRGAYHGLVARRQADSRSDGVTTFVIQALRNTSAPICRSLGFEEVCAQSLYAWSP